jgi:hypothetical protein
VKRFALALIAAALASECGTSSAVSQSPSQVKCQVTLATPPIMDAVGGSGSLSIKTEPECTWDASTTVSWISSLSPAAGQGTADMSFRVAANDGASTRNGSLVVNGEQVLVSQRASCRYDLGPSSHNVSASGGAGDINISTTAECSWTAAADVNWIELTSTPSGKGNGTVRFRVAPNQSGARTGAIVVANQRSTVAQSGVNAPNPNPSPNPNPNPSPNPNPNPNPNPDPNPSPTPPPASCTYSISSRSDSVPVAGGSREVGISTTTACAWTASSNASWISLTSAATGTGNGTVRYVVAANSGAPRAGTLTIAGQTLTVNQAAAECSYSVSPTRQTVAPSAGSATISISTASTCTWTASSSASWIALTSAARGTGSGTVTFSYLQNPDTSDRAGTVIVAGTTAVIEQRRAEEKNDGKDGEGGKDDDKDHKGKGN